jgi:hypothetical protein
MTTSDLTFFQFESDFVQSLRCIPMQVRYRLDTCGIKLKLEHWNKFTPEEREMLVTAQCETPAEMAAYRETLRSLVAHHTNSSAKNLDIDPHPPWAQIDEVPTDVQEQAEKFDAPIAIAEWSQLSTLERFALCKLSRPSHENRNFLSALYEFDLKRPDGESCPITADE